MATLKEVGGTKAVGVTFLEETFGAQTAHPKHRLHQKAARAVLKALLPESGTDNRLSETIQNIMHEIFDIVSRVAIWTGITIFTWSVSSSLEKIADALGRSDTSQDS